MPCDLAEAQRLIRQVRERSIGPGLTTLDDLARALEAAVHDVNALEGAVGGLKSALEGQREHAERSATLGRELQMTAREALRDAEEQERTALDCLARLLEQVLGRLTALDGERTHLQSALAAARAAAAHEQDAHERKVQTLTADLRSTRALASEHAATLARLAALPWWQRVFHAE